MDERHERPRLSRIPIRELPYGPAACNRRHQRPDTCQHLTTRRATSKIILAQPGAGHSEALCGGTGRSRVRPVDGHHRSASGRRGVIAGDERTREVWLRHSSCEVGEQRGAICRGADGAKGGDRGERGPASTRRAQDRGSMSHALDRVRKPRRKGRRRSSPRSCTMSISPCWKPRSMR